MSAGNARIARLLRLFPEHMRTLRQGLQGPPDAPGGERVVVQAAIFGAEGVLLAVRRTPRGWEFPGGHLAPGEAEAAGLLREVREETGLEVAAERFIGEYRRTGFWPHRARVWRCRPVGGALRPSAETQKLRWWNPAAPPATLLPWHRGPLADALANPPEARSRIERQGLRAILASLVIDARMRWSDDEAR